MVSYKVKAKMHVIQSVQVKWDTTRFMAVAQVDEIESSLSLAQGLNSINGENGKLCHKKCQFHSKLADKLSESYTCYLEDSRIHARIYYLNI